MARHKPGHFHTLTHTTVQTTSTIPNTLNAVSKTAFWTLAIRGGIKAWEDPEKPV